MNLSTTCAIRSPSGEHPDLVVYPPQGHSDHRPRCNRRPRFLRLASPPMSWSSWVPPPQLHGKPIISGDSIAVVCGIHTWRAWRAIVSRCVVCFAQVQVPSFPHGPKVSGWRRGGKLVRSTVLPCWMPRSWSLIERCLFLIETC